MKKQDLLLLLVLGGAFALMTVILLSMGVGPNRIKGQRFRAKPGTMRDTVMPIVSETQESGGPQSEEGEGGAGSTTLLVQKEALAEAAQAALDAATTEQGLRQIEQRLAQGVSDRERSDLENAKARLKLRLIPPDTKGALAAVHEAAQAAQSPEQTHRAAVVEAEILLLQEKAGEARAVLRETRMAYTELSSSRTRAGLIEAGLAFSAGDAADAARIYKEVMDEAESLAAEKSETALDTYRLAASRLAALLRANGQEQRAREIGESAQHFLARQEALRENQNPANDPANTTAPLIPVGKSIGTPGSSLPQAFAIASSWPKP